MIFNDEIYLCNSKMQAYIDKLDIKKRINCIMKNNTY